MRIFVTDCQLFSSILDIYLWQLNFAYLFESFDVGQTQTHSLLTKWRLIHAFALKIQPVNKWSKTANLFKSILN